MLKLKENSTAKTAIRITLLIGGVIDVLSFFLPWNTASGPYPFFEFFRNLPWSIVVVIFLQPQFILGIMVILGVSLKFRKSIYWISLAISLGASVWNPLFVLIILRDLAGLFGIMTTLFLGEYAAMIGPPITSIGLILHKLIIQDSS